MTKKSEFPPENQKKSQYDDQINKLMSSIGNKESDIKKLREQLEGQIKMFEKLGASEEEIKEFRDTLEGLDNNEESKKLAEKVEKNSPAPEKKKAARTQPDKVYKDKKEYEADKNLQLEIKAQKLTDAMLNKLKENEERASTNPKPETKITPEPQKPEDPFDAAKKRIADSIDKKVDEELGKNKEPANNPPQEPSQPENPTPEPTTTPNPENPTGGQESSKYPFVWTKNEGGLEGRFIFEINAERCAVFIYENHLKWKKTPRVIRFLTLGFGKKGKYVKTEESNWNTCVQTGNQILDSKYPKNYKFSSQQEAIAFAEKIIDEGMRIKQEEEGKNMPKPEDQNPQPENPPAQTPPPTPAEQKSAEIKQILEDERGKENLEKSIQLNGLSKEELEKIPEWNTLSEGEKLLVLEQISQETLSRVKEIGKQRFKENNRISFSAKNFNPFSFGKKIWKNFSKAYWISKEEKQVLNEFKDKKIGTDENILKNLINRTLDMHLDIIEKDGKAYIQFAKENEFVPEKEKEIIKKYNEVANLFARMPDSWKNEKSAESRNLIGWHDYHENYEKVQEKYEILRDQLLNIKVENYKYAGLNENEAKIKAMEEIGGEHDFRIAILQFCNTNPSVFEELNKIKKESSIIRLLNNENLFRVYSMSLGWLTRSATTSLLGFAAAPLISGVLGGIRARAMAKEKINEAFYKGRKMETSIERRELNKKGLFDNGNEKRSLLSKTLSGGNINAREVGSFIDADSQIQRINNLVEKIDREPNIAKRGSLLDQLQTRIEYIKDNHEAGLINYGTKDPIGVNYRLLKLMSEVSTKYVYEDPYRFLGEEETRKFQEETERRQELLGHVVDFNIDFFDKKQSNFKNREMKRGAAIGAGFAVLGWTIREWISGGGHQEISSASETQTMSEEDKAKIVEWNKRIEKIQEEQAHPHDQMEKIVTPNQPETPTETTDINNQETINAEEKTQTQTEVNNNSTEDTPAEKNEGIGVSVKELADEDSTKMAMKLGMYNPGSENESLTVQSGEIKFIDENNNEVKVEYSEKGAIQTMADLKEALHEKYGDNIPEGKLTTHYVDMNGVEHDQTLVGTNANGETVIEEHKGDKFDYDNSGVKAEETTQTQEPLNISEQQINPVTGEQTENSVNLTDNQLNAQEQQVDPVTGKVMDNNSSGLNTDMGDKAGESNNINLDQLPQAELEHVREVYNNNMEYLKGDIRDSDWNYVQKEIPAERLMELYDNGKVIDEFKPIVYHIQRLEQATDLHPYGIDPLNGHYEPESIPHFISRALEEAQRRDIIDEVTL